MSLDSFITHSRRLPEPVAISQEIRDRGLTFVATVFQAWTVEEAKACARHLKVVVHSSRPAASESFAWRCMVLKPGRSGLAGPEDFELNTGSEDDSEKWAGDRILKVMKEQAIIDAVVIVSRW